ncbi:hypothetical protein S40288_02721 [Stachybotrys chartarum IBT 40288]|nr:hypothetical protein S40288_02721 [Stachybotrys chartarum IBT 40288]
MATGNEYMRRASPNEQRTISREDLGFYNAVVVGAIYDFGEGVDPHVQETFFHPLTECIQQNPWLCVIVGDSDTDESYYERVRHVNLVDHVEIYIDRNVKDELVSIKQVVEANLNITFPVAIPPWKTTVLPLSARRCFVSFAFSHAIGDGMSGPVFHRSFLSALRHMKEGAPALVETPHQTLPPPFDTPERLPVSWSFLLRPLIAALMPKLLVNLLGLQSSASTPDKGTWTPTAIFYEPRTYRSRAQMFEVSAVHLDRVIHLSRSHGAKLSGTFNQLVTRALSKNMPATDVTNFISITAINMRKSIGAPETEMGEFASGSFVTHPRSTTVGPLTEDEWARAEESTRQYASSAAQLQNQPIALLRYAPSIRKWTLSKIGQRRDCSFELSNIGNFQGGTIDEADSGVSIVKMVFAQSGSVIGPCLFFNIASVKGSNLVCTVTWQEGALGIDGDESNFVDRVCGTLKEELESLG